MTLLEQIKREAKRLKRAEGIKHHEALDKVAKSHGYDNYRHAQRELGGTQQP